MSFKKNNRMSFRFLDGLNSNKIWIKFGKLLKNQQLQNFFYSLFYKEYVFQVLVVLTIFSQQIILVLATLCLVWCRFQYLLWHFCQKYIKSFLKVKIFHLFFILIRLFLLLAPLVIWLLHLNCMNKLVFHLGYFIC